MNNMKVKKRLLAVLLTMTLLFTLFPAGSSGQTVQAAEGDGATVTEAVSDISLTGNGRQAVGSETSTKYAVVTGTLKAPAGTLAGSWPNIGIKVTSSTANSNWVDTFQIIYHDGAGYSIKLPVGDNASTTDGEGNKSNLQDSVYIDREIGKANLGVNLDAIFTADGLQVKVIRLDNWAYFLIDSGNGFELVHRMAIRTGASTAFQLVVDGAAASDSVTMSGITVTSGKDAAVNAFAKSKITLKQPSDWDESSREDSIYFPVNSTKWTVEARVSLTNYNEYDLTIHNRSVYVSPSGFGQGLAIFRENSGIWKIQDLGTWAGYNITGSHAQMLYDGTGGMWIRWMRNGSGLSVYTSADGTAWSYLGTRSISADNDRGIYLDTQRGAALTDVNISLNTAISQSNGAWTSISGSTEETYAVLSGTLKLIGGLSNYGDKWPNVDIQVVGNNSSRWNDNFQILYAKEHSCVEVKVSGGVNRGTFDGVEVAEHQWSNKGDGLLEKIETEGGLGFKVVRMNDWAYFLADTGNGYEIIGRMAGLSGKATNFALHNADLLDTNTVMLLNAEVTTGKEAAADALAGSRLKVQWGKNVSGAADSVYFPVDSTEWTLQAKVTLPTYSEIMGTEAERRTVHVGPGPGTTDDNVNNAYAWYYGLGINHDKGTAANRWKIQDTGKWKNVRSINADHAALMNPEAGGMWVRWVRSGDKLSFYTSADGNNWTFVTARTDLGEIPSTVTGMHIDADKETVLTNISLTLDKGVLKGATVSLGEDIGVNFYMELSAKTLADKNAYVQFTLPGANHTGDKVMVKDAVQGTYNGKNYYIFTCGIAAKEMASDIKVKIVGGDGIEGREYTYQVKTYGDEILADAASTYTDDDKTMVKAMLNYGAYAQQHFEYNTGNLANAAMSEADKTLQAITIGDSYKYTTSGSVSGLSYYGTSLMTTAKTTIRHYFELTGGSIGDYTFKYGTTTVQAVKKNSYWYVESPGIYASKLGENCVLTVTKGSESFTLTYNPYINVKAILEGASYSDTSKNLMKALYWYGAKASEYQRKKLTSTSLSYSTELLSDGSVDSNLFYRNDKKTNLPDPFILDNTERDGYYYMYGTEWQLSCYRSKNLTDWEYAGATLGSMMKDESGNRTEAGRVVASDVWAPEVVYDADTGLYYMFFSATPDPDTGVSVSGSAIFQLFVATSKYPYKDFQLVNFTDAASCGTGNTHSINKSAYPQYYAKYVFMEPSWYSNFSRNSGGTVRTEYANYAGAIDPHPFVDEDGKKYLYWVDDIGPNGICVVEMENWLKPKWSTAKKITYVHYYTMADYQTAKNGGSVTKVSYENESSNINEGPTVVKHNVKYYLTYSANSYTSGTYLVAQAVADSPTGSFRKLTEAEGGVLLSGEKTVNKEISGTGHHSFMVVNGRRYIIYHRHDDVSAGGYQRNPAIDEVKWVKVKDKNGNDLDVMYVNGPTTTAQPLLESFGKYRNIAGEAKVSGSGTVSYLTDGLLSVSKYANGTFLNYIKETSITGKSTFTFEFDTARTVRAIMVYNSKNESKIFKNISKIELVCESGGREVLYHMNNVAFKSNYYETSGSTVTYVTPGAAACAVFDELYVKSIRITVDVPQGQSSVGISEIRILGK